MSYIDTHTHLYDEAFNEDCDAAVLRAEEAEVTKFILPDTNSKTRDAMFALIAKYCGKMFPCVGLHPTEVGDDWKKEMDLVDSLRDREDIVAIGETGMDCHWSVENIAAQEEAFRAQIDIAVEKNLPVIIHNREATELILKVLKDYKGRGLRGVFHAFSGSYETFHEIERCGDFFIGIGGVVTFPKASIGETVKQIPLDMIVTETDSPYLTPVPFRGKRNESSYIPYIAKRIADQKGIDVAQVAQTTWDNAHLMFGI